MRLIPVDARKHDEIAVWVSDDGRFRFDDLSQEAQFRIHAWSSAASGHLDGPIRAGADDLRIVLSRRGTIEGCVIDDDGDGVPDATVHANNLDLSEETGGPADGTGHFILRDLPFGDYVLRANDRYRNKTEADVVVALTPDSSPLNVVLRLPRLAEISGWILDGNQAPVQSTLVQASQARPRRAGLASRPALEVRTQPHLSAGLSDSDGRFVIRRLAAGVKYDLGVVGQDFAGEALGISAGGADIQIIVTRRHELGGRIEDRAGRPIVGAEAHVSRVEWPFEQPEWTVLTGGDGTFVLRGLPDGEYRLWGSAPRCVLTSPTRIGLDEDILDTLLVLDHAGSLSGHVQRPDGAPVAGRRIMATATSNGGEQPRQAYSVTTEFGDFEFDGLVHGVMYAVTLPDEQCWGGPPPGAVFGMTGDFIQVEVAACRTLTGKLVGGDGSKIPEFQVVLDRAGGAPASVLHQGTTSDGRFSLRNLWSGLDEVFLFCEGMAPRRLVLPEGGGQAADVGLIVLDHGSTLRGWIRDERGEPVEGAHIGVLDGALSTRSSEDGGFALEHYSTDVPHLEVTHDAFLPQLLPTAGNTPDAPMTIVLSRRP